MGAIKPRRGRPPLPLEGQRQRLLDAARQLLERRELETAGVRDVVAEAGMSSRAFYQVFESRDALILELAREMTEHFLERFEAVMDFSETLDPQQVADRLMDAYVEVAAPLVALDGARLPRSTSASAFVLGVPAIGPLVRATGLARFYRALGLLLEAGLPAAEASKVAAETTGVASLSSSFRRQLTRQA